MGVGRLADPTCFRVSTLAERWDCSPGKIRAMLAAGDSLRPKSSRKPPLTSLIATVTSGFFEHTPMHHHRQHDRAWPGNRRQRECLPGIAKRDTPNHEYLSRPDRDRHTGGRRVLTGIHNPALQAHQKDQGEGRQKERSAL
jgi:hypothetical protein